MNRIKYIFAKARLVLTTCRANAAKELMDKVMQYQSEKGRNRLQLRELSKPLQATGKSSRYAETRKE